MIIFRDNSGTQSFYEAIALIEHQGQMTSDGEGQGHYVCDIKTKNNHWYRTNDNNLPVAIKEENVTKNSLVVLYKKK